MSPVWAILGTFDVANYGDLLFPRLLARGVGDRADVVGVSPFGGQVADDAHRCVAFGDAPARVERVVIGGGSILHSVPEVSVYGRDAVTAYADLWYGALCLARASEAPLVWNAPGVPTVLGPVASKRVCEVARRSAYVSVRDEFSRQRLLDAGVDADVHVVPDPAWAVSELWPRAELRDTFRACVGDHDGKRVVAFQAGPHRVRESTAVVAASMAAVARKLDVTPLLLSISACHGDGALLTELHERLARDHDVNAILVAHEDGLSLRRVAACLAWSEAYVGGSMHGAITAMSYGRPALLVADLGTDKLDALCATAGDALRWVRRWAMAERQTEHFGEVGERAAVGVSAERRGLVDVHRAAVLDPELRGVTGNVPVLPGDDAEWLRELLGVAIEQLSQRGKLTRRLKAWSQVERARLVEERDVQRRVALALRAKGVDMRARIAALERASKGEGGLTSQQ